MERHDDQRSQSPAARPWRRVWWRRWLQRVLTSLHIACYRVTGGLIGHRLGPLSNLLLTTRGRRSGRSPTTVLTSVQSEGLLGLVASNFGSRTAPFWYRNLQEHPKARVQLKGQRWLARARPATPEEQERLWTAALAM